MKVIGPSHPTPKAHRCQNVRKYTRGFHPARKTYCNLLQLLLGSCVRTQNGLGTVGAGGLEPDVDASKDPRRVGQGSQPHQPMEET